MADEFVTSIQTLNLSASNIRSATGWPEIMINDYLTNLRNFLDIAVKADTLSEEVGSNTIGVLANRVDINTNTDNIAIVTQDLADHEADNSAHGVTGDNVGTEDFSQPATGGVVLLAALVADLTQIATADIAAAPALYDQTYTQSVTDLTNENKAKINEVVLKVNEIIAGQIASKQMAVI